MRKSIATAHNLITGEFTEVEKLKPLNADYRAISKVELFKANTGEMVQELVAENFVSITWDEMQKKNSENIIFWI